LTAGVDFESWEAGLVAIAVVNAVGVCGAGRVADAAVASTVVVIARWTVLGIARTGSPQVSSI